MITRIASILVLLAFTGSTAFAQPPTFLLKWGSFGTASGEFNNPTGLATDAAGNVYVADTGNQRIQKFTNTGIFITQWGSDGTGDGQFKRPVGVTTDAVGNVYVTDETLCRVQKFTNTGTLITKWGSQGSGPGQFDFPTDVATDANGSVYVAEYYNNNRVQKFTDTGTPILMWGSFGTGPGQFQFPHGVATGAAGTVYVSDQHRVQRFDGATGAYQIEWGSQGSGDGQFQYPGTVETDAGGNVYVTDGQNNRVQKFNGTTGAYQTQWGSVGGGDGQFLHPHGVATDAVGNIYVVDNGNNRVQKFGPPAGCINGTVRSTCQLAGLLGVRVEARAPGSNLLVGSGVTNSNGTYAICVPAGNYNISVVQPLDYLPTASRPTTVLADQTAIVNFRLRCAGVPGNTSQLPTWWLARVNEAIAGTGRIITPATFCNYLDGIVDHFANANIVPCRVGIYNVAKNSPCSVKLAAAQTILRFTQADTPAQNATRVLLTLMLNVVSGRINLRSVVTAPNCPFPATVAQDICYTQSVITLSGALPALPTVCVGGNFDYTTLPAPWNTSPFYCGYIAAGNPSGRVRVPCGLIPTSTPNVAYRIDTEALQFAATPNPGAGVRGFHFALPTAGHVSLIVYDVRGGLVAVVCDGEFPAGPNSISWDGRTTGGRQLGSGLYFARLNTPAETRTLKVLQMTR